MAALVTSGLILMLVASSFVAQALPDQAPPETLPRRETGPRKKTTPKKLETAPEPSTAQISPKTEPSREKELRDPFWPVGFKVKEKEKDKDNDVMQGVLTNWPVLKMKGITKASDGSYIAMLEKIGMVEAGNIIRIKRDNVIYSWKINTITGKGIAYEKLEAKPVKE